MTQAVGKPKAGKSTETSTVLVISSHVMTGAVGNRAAAFALERLGHPVWEVPTVILPWHPGHGPSTRQTIDAALFAKSLEDLANHPDFANLGAILTGYMGSVDQVRAVTKLVDRLKAKNSDALYLCDPVMGEESGLYIAQEIAEAIRDELVPRADIITPNRFEFNWLTASKEDSNEALAKQSKKLDRPSTLITSAFPMMRNSIANLLIHAATQDSKEQALLCEHRSIPNPPSGTGDMIAALFLARKLAGQKDELALKLASSATLDVVSSSASQGYRDLEVARFADCFLHPMAMVNTRTITANPIVKKAKKYKPNSA
ncbi:pyridoxal kinase [Cohaesibacter celericrescens]|uniref:pyridoxal kinase n=1 Tax=Cohaesibacter celericrescens TaxID=2067669 RepID=A0A2N5XPA7_9HYPH|nr:pyridoxal kinase [Cohaesibacter celericrescens]PLW76381.1 pyridoxal kinase [Cohaesibacter celericrescens]